MKYRIHFVDVDDMQKFVTAINRFGCDVNLYDDHKCIDAKSLIAVMNLDLRKKFWVEFVTDEEALIVEAQKIIKDLLV